MLQRFSTIFPGKNQNVSGMAYVPLTSGLRAADVPLTLPLTLTCQEAFRAMKSDRQVFPSFHHIITHFRLEQRTPA
ncbi:MAG: hypothetical protein GX491_08335 [Chloroflexi bacterium]|nr:hypothetical protein [Chloroflexota bacterium]